MFKPVNREDLVPGEVYYPNHPDVDCTSLIFRRRKKGSILFYENPESKGNICYAKNKENFYLFNLNGTPFWKEVKVEISRKLTIKQKQELTDLLWERILPLIREDVLFPYFDEFEGADDELLDIQDELQQEALKYIKNLL